MAIVIALIFKNSWMYPLSEEEELILDLYLWIFQNHPEQSLAAAGKSF